MGNTKITPKDASDKRQVQAGKSQQFTFHIFKRHLIEVEDLHFHHDSARPNPLRTDYSLLFLPNLQILPPRP